MFVCRFGGLSSISVWDFKVFSLNLFYSRIYSICAIKFKGLSRGALIKLRMSPNVSIFAILDDFWRVASCLVCHKPWETDCFKKTYFNHWCVLSCRVIEVFVTVSPVQIIDSYRSLFYKICAFLHLINCWFQYLSEKHETWSSSRYRWHYTI